MTQKDEYSLLILGLDNAGKTTFLEKARVTFNPEYKAIAPGNITATVGLNVGEILYSGVKLKFWDLGGQKELHVLWDKYYAESHGVLYLIDSCDKDRFDESRIAFDKMIRSKILDHVPLLIIVNKQDMKNAYSVSEMNNVFCESLPHIGARDCSLKGTSGLTGEGVADSIKWMVDKVKTNAHRRPPLRSGL